MEFIATIYLLSSEEGGRKSPIASGYRPAFYFGEKQTDGAILFDDRDHIVPGSTHTVKVRLLHPEVLEDELKTHAIMELREGFKVVGRGAIERRVLPMSTPIKDVRCVLYMHYDAPWEDCFKTWQQHGADSLPDHLPVIDEFSQHLEHLKKLLQKEIERSSGVLVLFLDYGLGDMLEQIVTLGMPHANAKLQFSNRHPELKFAERVKMKFRELAAAWQLEQRIRVLTPLDLIGIFKNMSEVSVLQYVVGDGNVRYDSPKFIEAIVRARLLGSGIPVFRVDRDVLLPSPSEPFYFRYHHQLEAAIANLIEGLNEHHRHTRILSTIMSCNYERPSLESPEVIAWARGYATRIQPALLVFDALAFDGHQDFKWHSDDRWQTYARAAFNKTAMDAFFGSIRKWGAPTTGVISGALLYMSEGVVLGLPPFSNFSENISWIDDHLRYAIHRELGDFCPETVFNEARQPLHVRLDESQVIKCRTGFKDLPTYTIQNYFPTLLRGAIFDYWISADPIVKQRQSEIPAEDLNRWAKAKSGAAAGPLAKEIKQVRSGAAPPNNLHFLRGDLEKAANERLLTVKSAWQTVKSEKGEPTFASAWAEGTLPDWVTRELGDPAWHSMDAFLDSPLWREPLDKMIKEAMAYLYWVVAWPRVLHVVRALAQGSVPSDIGWSEKEAARDERG